MQKMVTPAGKRQAVVHLCEAHSVSHAIAPAGDCKAICREAAGV
jgi:hypothetical protein